MSLYTSKRVKILLVSFQRFVSSVLDSIAEPPPGRHLLVLPECLPPCCASHDGVCDEGLEVEDGEAEEQSEEASDFSHNQQEAGLENFSEDGDLLGKGHCHVTVVTLNIARQDTPDLHVGARFPTDVGRGVAHLVEHLVGLCTLTEAKEQIVVLAS